MSRPEEDRNTSSLEEDQPPPATPDLDPSAKAEARKDEPRLFHIGSRTLTRSSAENNSNPTQDTWKAARDRPSGSRSGFAYSRFYFSSSNGHRLHSLVDLDPDSTWPEEAKCLTIDANIAVAGGVQIHLRHFEV
ncbi:hypothetical protein Q3G72_029328 [Acer saccharum]|nr:hypothetical protein Q3G72_008476 [Acer saccharum]KAK1568824.1 hypothetical protein Q3G72_029328 [Acer saccharum]